jgi:hypothetical protein
VQSMQFVIYPNKATKEFDIHIKYKPLKNAIDTNLSDKKEHAN